MSGRRGHDTACPDRSATLALKPFRESITLPPRIARRLRARAHDNGRSPAAEAALLLAKALVPVPDERRRLARLDLADALGEGGNR